MGRPQKTFLGAALPNKCAECRVETEYLDIFKQGIYKIYTGTAHLLFILWPAVEQ